MPALPQKVLDKDRYVVQALAQGRGEEDHHRQAMVEIQSKST
jgi:hypothetical protein